MKTQKPHRFWQSAVWRPWRVGRSISTFVFAWTLVSALLLVGIDYLWPDFAGAQLSLSSGQWMVMKTIVFAAVIWWVLRQAFKPVLWLGHDLASRRVEDLRQISHPQPGELMQLAAAINQLMQQQQASFDQQKKFLADASHQLRTPFAVLRTQLQGVMSGQLETRDTLPKMLSTVDRSSDLVRQLLAMAKVEQVVRRENWTEVDLAAVARDVVMEFAPLLARKKLDFSLQAIPVCLLTDAWLLGELIRNLMSNAIHHTPKGGALGLVIRVLPGGTELLVWDNGGGMDEAVQARLFEPFQSSSGAQGVGLGLSICRQIAISMNAVVELFNRVQDDRTVGVDAVVRWSHESVAAGGMESGAVSGDDHAGLAMKTPSFWNHLAHGSPITQKGRLS
ncbi:MAG: HAMP domain-containing sensor histidine kinase [Pseudomonadota bacterium]